jgi:hypothetical protein
MTNEPNNTGKGPDRFEEELGELSTAWREMDAPEPPDLVDQAVRNTARRDLESATRRRPLRWIGGLATASLMVIALSIVVQQDAGRSVSLPEEQLELRLEKSDRPAGRNRTVGAAEKREPPPATMAAEPAAQDEPARKTARPMQAPAAAALEEFADDVADAELLSAEEWLVMLLRLQQEGRSAELVEQLDAFRAAYPDHPLPESLQDL